MNKENNITKAWEPKIVAFLCNWCSYAGADLAGVSRMQYPTNVHVVRVPCSGRVDPLYILKALMEGADGVLVSGCHPGDCHYISGNLVARRKFSILKNFLEYIGIEKTRVQFSWVSASEGSRFASLIEKVTNDVKKLGPRSFDESAAPAATQMKGLGKLGDLDTGIQGKMQEAVGDLFKDHKVDMVLGYEKGSLNNVSRPFFAKNADDAEKMVWDTNCLTNLAVYLPGLFEKPERPKDDYTPPKVGIIAKGCDARSIIGLVKENQIQRENITIIGMPCSGMAEKDGKSLAEQCGDCVSPIPENADINIEGTPIKISESKYSRTKDFEDLAPEMRWNRFVSEVSRCIRCNACRQVCPNCYCKSCFADQSKPAWIGKGDRLADVLLYHVGRMFHQAGRCVSCAACVTACPMDIDLRLFTEKLVKDADSLFDCVPGMSEAEKLPLSTFKQDDNECFITDPEEK